MKPWFVLFVLWALSGIVTLRHAYAEEGASLQVREPVVQTEEQNYVF